MPVVKPAALAVLAALAAAAAAAARPLPEAPGCPVLPPDSHWNQRVDRLPVAAGSRVLIRAMEGFRLHPDFSNRGGYGIPYTTVGAGQPRVPVSFDYSDESDQGPYPIPPAAPVESGSDRHVLVVDRDACRLYELFAAERRGGGWHAGSGAVFDLRSNRMRPAGWTSADAAGLPILPGLARADEVAGAGIDHALRITVSRSQRAYLYPARHFASSDRNPARVPMGLRLRLKRGYSLAGFGPQARAVLRALKSHGAIVADNGSSGYITGAPSPRWDDDDLRDLRRVPASAFEVVDTTRLPATPRARVVNPRVTTARGRTTVRFLLTAASPVTVEARRGRRVVRRVHRRSRQGFVTVRLRTVAGARYVVRAR